MLVSIMIQIILLILVYLASSFVNNPPLINSSNYKNKKKQKIINWRGFNVKRIITAILTGSVGVLIMDLASRGEPIWPALALPALVVGELYPLWKTSAQENTGIFAYFGGIFYLNPALALICLGLTVELLIVGKDKLLAILIFTGLLPALIWYSRINPIFFWSSVAVELLIWWEFKMEILTRIKPEKSLNNPKM